MRRMSFSLTTKQFLDGSKDVTRRVGWWFLKPSDHVLAVEKAMGLKKGEKQVVLGEIEIVSVTPEYLSAVMSYPPDEAAREGFPNMRNLDFIEMFCREMKVRPNELVNRIEFRRI